MDSCGDERAVTVQVGAVILLAFVVIAIATYQAQVVPQQNSQVEYNHNQQVQQRMQELRDEVQSVPATGTGGSVSVPLGTTYPARSIFVNPSPPTGTLATVGTTNSSISLAIGNANATESETRNFWNGTTRSFTTGALVYQPRYNAYQNAPVTVYENSLVYNRFDTANITLTGQDVVDGKRITLVALNGSLRESTGTASVTLRPVSASTQSITVENTTGDRLTVTIPSTLTASEWRTLLQDSGQYDGSDSDPNAYVDSVSLNRTVTSPEFGQEVYFVDIVLEQGETYNLRMAKVGVGTGVTSSEDGAYLAPVGSTSRQTPTGGSETLTVQVRDRFNNPESGVTVNASVVSGPGSITNPDQVDSGEDGTASFTYQASSSTGTATVRMNISTSPTSWEMVNFSVQVQNTGDGGGNGAYQVEWQDPSGQTGVDCPSGPNGTCSVNGSKTTSVDLTMGTFPTADGASASYAVNNSTVGTVSPQSGTTNSAGEDSTTLSLSENGTVVVYATSGAGGDSITLDVNDLPGSGGGAGDNTPPTLDSARVDANSLGNNDKTDTLTFDYQTSDNINVANVTLKAVFTKNAGTVLVNDTTTTTDDTNRVYDSFGEVKMNQGDIDITIQVTDTSGNVRTCSGTIRNDGGTLNRANMTCSSTPNILPSPSDTVETVDSPHPDSSVLARIEDSR